jgi:hypothetical protein
MFLFVKEVYPYLFIKDLKNLRFGCSWYIPAFGEQIILIKPRLELSE